MLHYLFTNDLRISTLDSTLFTVANMVQTNTIPSAVEDKSVNNNAKTLQFYFNLIKDGQCTSFACNKQIRRVVLNFIKKFQFPNLRTPESYSDSISDGIWLAPMREIVKLLHIAFLCDGSLGYITRDEMRDFVFYNKFVATKKNPNMIDVYHQLLEYRASSVLPSSIVPQNEREWKHEERQIREMIKVLIWSGCVIEDDNKFRIVSDGITETEKSELYDIITCKSYWLGGDKSSYEAYMEIETEIIEEEIKAMIDRTPRTHITHELNTILYGAPGTGKTYSTAEYALAILENRAVDKTNKTAEQRAEVMSKYKEMVDAGRIVFTTFHQSYGYEDFIQGLRPVTNATNMTFKPVDGVFKAISDRAMVDTENDYVIIIDEINRANISKVFGELITLIEDDKRWGEVNALSVILPSGEPFAVPNNLYIVGTMNSADKSISLIDTALRRRFEFVEVTPNVSLVGDAVLKEVLKRINEELFSQLESTDLLIGHAYFIGKEASDLCTIMNRSIIPLLYEYFYDKSPKVKSLLEKAVNGFDFSVVGGNSGRLRIVEKA